MDQYAMSMRDVQLVDAAHTVLFLRCANGHDELDSEELENVRQTMNEPMFASERWMFGHWDAPFISATGDQRVTDSVPLGPRPVDHSILSKCVNEDQTVLTMQTVAPTYGLMALADAEFMPLVGYWWEGVSLAEADPRYLELNKQRNTCTQSHGYAIYFPDNDNIGWLSYQDGWTPEQQLRAKLVEANCSDDMRFTQQLIDMVATYQMATIAQHQAELVAMKQNLDERVARAKAILADLGLL
ncbi:MAG: hypothetical protein FWD80_06055 [Propionibacteriaceae bacterium]|nr:hypothetical protein [Propionibacteriaceae bacterium]